MAKRERNKRAARKARQQERERVEAARAVAAGGVDADKKAAAKSTRSKANKTKKTAIAKADRKGIQKVTGYFSDVATELHKVTWPSQEEMRNYTVAVIAMLIVFGVAIWLVDTGFVAGLVAFTGLRG